MNEQQRAVVQQALEAINEELAVDMTDMDAVDQAAEMLCKVSTDLRQLLEQPEPVQEPVGEVSGHDWSTGLLYRDLEPGTLLYTTPPAQPAAWVGLADEDRLRFLNELLDYGTDFVAPLDGVIRAIEAKLREKNGHKL